MAKSIRANLELASVEEVKNIGRLDAAEVSSTPEAFVQENLLSYYILVNCWLMIVRQWSTYGWTFLFNFIKTKGLIEAIRRFDQSADQIVHGEEVTFGIARNIYNDVLQNPSIIGVPHDREREITSDPMAAMLFICRFPKRFSPVRADLLREASIKAFDDTQKRLKMLQRRPNSEFIISRVREEVRNLLDWTSLTSELNRVHLDEIVFTPGVTFDTDANLLSKLQSMAEKRVEYFYQPFGIPMVASRGVAEQQYWGKHHDFERHDVRLIAVPKNYKTARVIAPEDVVRQAYARRYFIIADGYLPDLIQLHDQTKNQELAFIGSLDGKLATLDLHAASDSLTLTLLWSILPSGFMEVMTRVLPTHYIYNEKVKLLQSAATMGNSMTFWLESVVFAGISRAAVKFYNLLAGGVDDTVSVYGDDIIVPTEAAPTVIEWLEALGFIVNHEKSFFDKDHPYRESCGEEYFRGICVSSRYFPRFPLEGKLGGKFSIKSYKDGFRGTRVDTMMSALDLQHKLFYVCVPASLLVAEIIREAEPRMTTSSPDLELQDLWSYDDQPRIIPAPAGRIVDGKVVKMVVPGFEREAHLGPITVYPEAKDTTDETLVSLYNYQNFLKFGPRYDSPLDQLLGVSAPPISYREARSRSEIKWALIK